MLLSTGILVVLVGSAPASSQHSYTANGIDFADCESAIDHAERSSEPVTVECHVTMQFDGSQPAVTEAGPTRLRDYRQTDEFALDDPDGSGVTFVSDDMVLITFQDSLQFRDLGGRLLGTVGPFEGDVEGLEYQGERLIAVDEKGSRHVDLTVDGTTVDLIEERALPFDGVECVAVDPHSGEVYYGQEWSGNVLTATGRVLFSFTRDLAACTVHRGEFMALVSHPWRQSLWFRMDLNNWSVLEEKRLPDGNWEGIACRDDTCVLVREASEKSGAAMVIYQEGR